MEGVDPGHEYAVPFYWGTNTFAINTERVKKALGTDQLPDNQWDLVFNPEYTSKTQAMRHQLFGQRGGNLSYGVELYG